MIKVIIPRNEVVMVDDEGNPLFVEPLTGGEKLVEIGTFNDFVKPLWSEQAKDFIESATPEEIEAARPKPSTEPTETELLKAKIAELESKNTVAFEALAEIYELMLGGGN